ncbi:ceramide glucosyltransferase [Hyphomicrobium denitrificans 1NES1]|uniref:Ceramide glucosyltransferase n=1 Tax=Hyphomicrobium denitrificans 1NES1 TaxID=670307 RepID=N0B6W0_9HYPH|nr:ceramide glucosyltransferase [Hyphomicrobium denitrificans]AGK59354.1 ceramide glucosyltransferase [Hyphomicrobium denitrificans 1NES1]
MAGLATAALIFCALATAIHLITIALAFSRVLSRKRPSESKSVPVSIIRPVCGIDHFDILTLRSTFELQSDSYEIIFCAAREGDPAVPLVRKLIAENSQIPAKLLIGDDRPTSNPKLNNIVKGWEAARYPWIVLADNNVLMPPDYLDDLFASFGSGVGLVCSPPVGSHPIGFRAELECAFLNTYQARWQSAADAVGFGFAQGKSMLWRRDILDAVGGIEALGREIAEDAAATKIVRARGLNVRLVDRPFEQPLGLRKLRQVWDRQVRWARLRRATFQIFYVPEVFAGSFFPILAGVASAASFDVDPSIALFALAGIWFGAEAVLALAAGWHLSMLSPLSWIARDLLLPVLWLEGWSGDTFVWRGNDMSVAKGQEIPQASSCHALVTTGDVN